MHKFTISSLGTILAVALFAGGGLASAAPKIEATPVPAAQKPDFSSMKFLAGTWNCINRSARRPGPYKTTVTYAMDSSGYWMTSHNVVHPASWIPHEFAGDGKMTYNASSKQWVEIDTDDRGGYAVQTSNGWHGNSMTWSDALASMSGNIVSMNPTVQRKVSDTQITSSGSFKVKSGRTIMTSTVCTKTT